VYNRDNMKKLSCFLLVILYCAVGIAQSRAGITGMPDTSFTTYKTFVNTQKTHPDIRMVEEIKRDTLGEVRNHKYADAGMEGRQPLLLDAFFTVPRKGRQPAPAIIIIHGGGWRSGDRSQHHALAQRLALLGYVCFTPQYRLSTMALYPAAVHDIKYAIQWVKFNSKTFNIDTQKVAVLGFSAGGELAAFAGATNGMPQFDSSNYVVNTTSTVHAVIDIDGILAFIHPESGEGNDEKGTSAATNWFGYSKTQNPELWKQGSPLTHVGKHTPPTLFLNSSVARMHAGRDDYIKVLNQFGIYSEVHEFQDAPHSFILFEPWFTPSVRYIDAFLKKVFK